MKESFEANYDESTNPQSKLIAVRTKGNLFFCYIKPFLASNNNNESLTQVPLTKLDEGFPVLKSTEKSPGNSMFSYFSLFSRETNNYSVRWIRWNARREFDDVRK